ncbi:MAG TPA: polyprenyl synthetase family protein, partial [Gemmatimonadaceae bacterium]|nr:polyprenyl synthetase family protein [Gemmatimonadaceae bacterium]
MSAVSSSVSPRATERPRGEDLVALVRDEMRLVEAKLAERMESPVGAIPQVGAHLLGAGGKRLRPLLAMLGARAAGASIDHGVAVGVAAELIHTATLYHDDVVDDGRVRRGRPAARMVFGNGVVVLVGDFCLARALETVALTGSLPMVQSLAATVTEMAEGEVAQLERAGNPDATVEDYFRVIDRKTASLIAWCARVGGAVGPELDGPLERYGRALGRAFQIADDLLDADVDEATAGKS